MGLAKKLKNVNTTDIEEAIRLACRTMCSVFDEDDNGIPFFVSCVWPEAYMAFSTDHTESHVPGRHLNALLNAEYVLGIKINDDCIKKHADAAFFSYSGSVPYPLNRQEIKGKPDFLRTHNIREGFHALYALTKYRDSTRAREIAEDSIDTTLKIWDPQKGWDQNYFSHHNIRFKDDGFIQSIGRALGPIVKFYKVTNYKPALELASLLKEKAINEFYHKHGRYDIDSFGIHGHSITCVMSSLAQMSEFTSDELLMSRVRAFYDNGLLDLSDKIGWSIENTGPEAIPDLGECNNTGDMYMIPGSESVIHVPIAGVPFLTSFASLNSIACPLFFRFNF